MFGFVVKLTKALRRLIPYYAYKEAQLHTLTSLRFFTNVQNDTSATSSCALFATTAWIHDSKDAGGRTLSGASVEEVEHQK